MSPLPHVPGYDLLRPLGGGPLTEVFAARSHDDDRLCALKVPREIWPGHTTAVRLLRREHRALCAVRHPNLVRLLDAHVIEPPYFLAFEFIDGESLRDRLQREYCLDLRISAWIARQMAEALASLHKAGFIHGDVKPENVRLSDTGSALLVDLGFAHRSGENGIFADDAYVLGTANYLAPELHGDHPHDGPAADWFSFGVMVFEMLTGTLPEQSGAMRSRAWPARLTALLEGLLASQPDARPADAMIVHELIALEIAALGRRRAG
jgi:eukaryotic-like serine/threonine-protein kinase